jgi:LPXTG-motif cell wall-anchored protein
MPLDPRRFATAVTGAAAIALLIGTLGAVPSVEAAPDSNKVTICHRTHSVTNPYRMITVSANAADGIPRGARNDHVSHDLSYTVDDTTYLVFDPSVSYPPTQKHWGDIIPPVRRGDGLNWNAPGAQAIYTGTGTSFGLCRRMSAKQFFDIEVEALPPGLTPDERNTALDEILEDLDDQGALEDDKIKDELDIDEFSDLDPTDLPSGLNDLPNAPLGTPPPGGFGAEPGRQKIAVVVWFDLDRDGAFDRDEEPAPGVTVSLDAILEASSADVDGSSILSTAADDYVTDAQGTVIVNDIPAGQWDVAAVPPDDVDVTFDSEGTADDGRAQVDVPADSAGFAWVGLVPAAAGAGGDDDAELARTGASSVVPASLGAAAILLLVGAGFLRRRRGAGTPSSMTS